VSVVSSWLVPSRAAILSSSCVLVFVFVLFVLFAAVCVSSLGPANPLELALREFGRTASVASPS
jgi:hypothetical protein